MQLEKHNRRIGYTIITAQNRGADERYAQCLYHGNEAMKRPSDEMRSAGWTDVDSVVFIE